jgi:hypothetical protein
MMTSDLNHSAFGVIYTVMTSDLNYGLLRDNDIRFDLSLLLGKSQIFDLEH